jgi:hypothetical protein
LVVILLALLVFGFVVFSCSLRTATISSESFDEPRLQDPEREVPSAVSGGASTQVITSEQIAAEVIQEMRQLSPGLDITDDGRVSAGS